MKETILAFLEGDTTMSKKEFWLTVTSCTLLGVLIGVFCAPAIKGSGIALFSGNGSNNGNTAGECKTPEKEEGEADEAECRHKRGRRHTRLGRCGKNQ